MRFPPSAHRNERLRGEGRVLGHSAAVSQRFGDSGVSFSLSVATARELGPYGCDFGVEAQFFSRRDYAERC